MPSLRDPDSIQQSYVYATAGQTTVPLPVAGIRSDCLEVWLNGIQQDAGVGWTRSADNVVFIEPLTDSDIVRLVWSNP